MWNIHRFNLFNCFVLANDSIYSNGFQIDRAQREPFPKCSFHVQICHTSYHFWLMIFLRNMWERLTNPRFGPSTQERAAQTTLWLHFLQFRILGQQNKRIKDTLGISKAIYLFLQKLCYNFYHQPIFYVEFLPLTLNGYSFEVKA